VGDEDGERPHGYEHPGRHREALSFLAHATATALLGVAATTVTNS